MAARLVPTEAAIRAFQAAKGLTVDGLLGSQTEGALVESVAAGEIVCTSSGDEGDNGGEASGSVATLSSSGYGPKDFTIGSCSFNGETGLALQTQADNITLLVDASDSTGTLSVDGGTEGDGITLNGDIDGVSLGDAGGFSVTGTFAEPNNVGEEFELAGSCAGL